jgi:PKD repeat protein
MPAIMFKLNWRVILPFVLIWFPQGIQAQYFNKVSADTSGIEAYATVEVLDSAIYCYGFSVPSDQAGFRRRHLTKVDEYGDTIWKHTYFKDTAMNFHEAYADLPAYSGNDLFICGCNESPPGYCNAALMNLNLNGDTLWTREYDLGDGSTLANVRVLKNGDLFLAGTFQAMSGPTDALIMKTDSSGNIKWQYFVGGAGSEIVLRSDTLSASRYLISGYTSSFGAGQTDAWVCLLDSSGTVISQRTFGYADGDIGFAKVINSDTLLVFGDCMRPPDFESVPYVLRADENLNFLDTFYVDEVSNPFYNSLSAGLQSERGEYVLAGVTFDSLINNPVGYIVCLDKNLNQLWLRKYKARNNDNYFTDIALMPDGGFMVSGYVFPEYGFDSTSGSWVALNTQDGWLVRTNCLGWLSNPVPQFSSYNVGNNTVRFDNHSQFAEEYLWDFGDGAQYSHTTSLQDTLSSIPYVEHTYATPGSYTATLYAIACGDTITLSHTIVADPVSVIETNGHEIKVYPNPTGGNAFVESPTLANYHTLQVYNDAGQWVYSTTITAQANRLEIPSSSWANGIYVVTLEGTERIEKIVLMKTE